MILREPPGLVCGLRSVMHDSMRMLGDDGSQVLLGRSCDKRGEGKKKEKKKEKDIFTLIFNGKH